MGWIIMAFFVVLAGILLLTLINRIPFPENWIIDRLGELVIKEPGYRIIVKWFGIEKIYAKIKTGVQYAISLFSDKENITIDLKKGGQLILKDPRIWIVVNNPLQAYKTATNFEEQIREMAEHRLTGFLNSLTYEEVMEMKIPKIREVGTIAEKIDEIISSSQGLKSFMQECGIGYKGFTLDDFDFDEETNKKREERIATEMGKEIAQNIAEARRNEMGSIIAVAKGMSDIPLSEAIKIASERYQDHLAVEKGELKKIIWTGGGGSIPELASLWEVGRGLIRGVGSKSEGNKEKEKNKEEEEQGFSPITPKQRREAMEKVGKKITTIKKEKGW